MGCEVRKTGAHPDLFCPNRPNYAIIMMMPGGMPGGGMGGGRAPMLVLNPNTQRQGDDSTKTQTQNVGAAKAVGDLIRTCLGPKAILKMLMDPMGGIVMTNDGNAILREITVQNPAAKMLIEIARTQDEEVGDSGPSRPSAKPWRSSPGSWWPTAESQPSELSLPSRPNTLRPQKTTAGESTV